MKKKVSGLSAVKSEAIKAVYIIKEIALIKIKLMKLSLPRSGDEELHFTQIHKLTNDR